MPKNCWCGNDKLEEYSEHYYRCDHCHTLVSKWDFSSSIYEVKDEKNDLYGEQYWSSFMTKEAGVDSLEALVDLYLRHRAIYWLKYFLQHQLPPANIAEIGGGLGQFAYLLQKTGFNITEFELSPYVCRFSQENLGVNSICQDFTKHVGIYDCVIAFDLIEHILNPIQFIQAISEKTTDTGGLFLQTPYYNDALTYEKMLQDMPEFPINLRKEQHIYIYSKSSIEILLHMAGFDHIVFSPAIYSGYDMFLWASKKPSLQNSKEQINSTIRKSKNGHLINALINTFDDKQLYCEKYLESEKDRIARYELLQVADRQLQLAERQQKSAEQQLQSAEQRLQSAEQRLQSAEQQLQKMQSMRYLIKHVLKWMYRKYVSGLTRKRRLPQSIGTFCIAIDVTPAHSDGSVGGAMEHAFLLIEGLSRMENTKVVVITNTANSAFVAGQGIAGIEIIEVGIERNKKENGVIRDVDDAKLLERHGVHVLLCPFSALTYRKRGIPSVSVVNDIQHVFYPEFFSEREAAHRNKFYEDIAANSNAVICISNYTKMTFCEQYAYPLQRATTIYISTDISSDKEIDQTVLDKFDLEENKFLLYPANFWEHKNHRLLLVAFSGYVHETGNHEIKLVLTGNTLDKDEYFKDVCRQLGIETQVVISGYVSSAELQTFSHAMKGLCFPSLFEGFGIPVAEAILNGKPIACSNTTSLGEISEGCAYGFNPAHIEDIKRGIRWLVEHETDAEQIAKYAERRKLFTKETILAQYLAVLQNAAGFDAEPKGSEG